MTAGTAPYVLIVSDEGPLSDQFATWLRGDYRVETAANPQRAPEELPDGINVVLLDQRFADPTARGILERTATRVGLILSFEPEWDVIEAGYDGHITKPVTREEVLDLVDRLVKRTRYEDDLETFFELVSERAAVTAGGADEGLEHQPDAGTRDLDIAELQAELQDLLDSFDRQDYLALFRDIGVDRE